MCVRVCKCECECTYICMCVCGFAQPVRNRVTICARSFVHVHVHVDEEVLGVSCGNFQMFVFFPKSDFSYPMDGTYVPLMDGCVYIVNCSRVLLLPPNGSRLSL